MLLRGRCSHCHKSIGYLTFIGEINGGVIILMNPLTGNGFIEMIFQFLCLFISEQDYLHYSIFSWSLILLSFITLNQLFLNQELCLTYLVGIALSYGVASIINHYHPFIGNGDLDFIFILILKSGLTHALIIVTLASLLAIVKYVIHHSTKFIPFVPYLSLVYIILQSIKK